MNANDAYRYTNNVVKTRSGMILYPTEFVEGDLYIVVDVDQKHAFVAQYTNKKPWHQIESEL